MAKAASARTRVSTKGQVILPKAIRDKRKWTAGTELTVEETAEGVLLKPAPIFAPTRVEEVAGMLRGRASHRGGPDDRRNGRGDMAEADGDRNGDDRD